MLSGKSAVFESELLHPDRMASSDTVKLIVDIFIYLIFENSSLSN